MGAESVNCSYYNDGIRIRVMCPKCGSGGAHYINSYQPKCDRCHDSGEEVYMEPASNNKVECTWQEALALYIPEEKMRNLGKYRENRT